jgi:hypothetical protein
VQPPKFEAVAGKHLSRYDRDCPQWFTKLAYSVKDNGRSARSQLNFEAQTLRKDNLVRSAYPIRLAI